MRGRRGYFFCLGLEFGGLYILGKVALGVYRVFFVL